MTVYARLAQLAKFLTANQEVPGTTPGTVDLVSSLSTLFRRT